MKYLVLMLISMLCCFCGKEQFSNLNSHNFSPSISKLSINGSKLIDENNNEIQLKGLSSHGLQWSGAYTNHYTLNKLKRDYNHNVYRLAMYTDEGGYLQNPNIKYKVFQGIDDAIDLGLYVIVDWHILKDRNPLWNVEKAKQFFDEVSKKYANVPNVIYEICNEPNGWDVKWNNSIKPYAEQVIPVIRKNDENAIIIVGTGTWSQDIHEVWGNPLRYNNIMYAVHFYASSHKDWLRNRIYETLKRNLPVFITEFGTMDASGNGGINYSETHKWMTFLDDNKISWTNWSMSATWQKHSFLKPNSSAHGWSDRDLSENGNLIKRYSLKNASLSFQDDSIHIIGDSIFTTINHRIKNLLEQKFNQPIFDHSSQGAWTKDILEQYKKNRGTKEILILDGGGNDVFGNSWNCKQLNDSCKNIISASLKNQSEIINLANQDNVKKIIYLGLHYPNDSAYRKVIDYAYPKIEDICKKSKNTCLLVDLRKPFENRKDLLEWDGIHPNWRGTDLISNLIFETAKKNSPNLQK